MNEWTAAAPVIVDTAQPDPAPARPARRLDISRRRTWASLPKWQQAGVITLAWAGVWTLIVDAACRFIGVPSHGYAALLLAGCAVVWLLITAIAWKYGRLS
jgi:hypothetical protein